MPGARRSQGVMLGDTIGWQARAILRKAAEQKDAQGDLTDEAAQQVINDMAHLRKEELR